MPPACVRSVGPVPQRRDAGRTAARSAASFHATRPRRRPAPTRTRGEHEPTRRAACTIEDQRGRADAGRGPINTAVMGVPRVSGLRHDARRSTPVLPGPNRRTASQRLAGKACPFPLTPVRRVSAASVRKEDEDGCGSSVGTVGRSLGVLSLLYDVAPKPQRTASATPLQGVVFLLAAAVTPADAEPDTLVQQLLW